MESLRRMKSSAFGKKFRAPKKTFTWITAVIGLLFVGIGLSHWRDTWRTEVANQEEYNFRNQICGEYLLLSFSFFLMVGLMVGLVMDDTSFIHFHLLIAVIIGLFAAVQLFILLLSSTGAICRQVQNFAFCLILVFLSLFEYRRYSTRIRDSTQDDDHPFVTKPVLSKENNDDVILFEAL